MNDTVSVVVAHRLGKVEAVRRLREGLARTNGQLGAMVTMEQETWRGDGLFFRMRALGQTASGSIDVLEDALASKWRCIGSLRKQQRASSTFAQRNKETATAARRFPCIGDLRHVLTVMVDAS